MPGLRQNGKIYAHGVDGIGVLRPVKENCDRAPVRIRVVAGRDKIDFFAVLYPSERRDRLYRFGFVGFRRIRGKTHSDLLHSTLLILYLYYNRT